MKILLIGSVAFSENALRELISLKANVVGVCTLEKSAFNSDHVDLSPVAKEFGISVRYTPDINDPSVLDWIDERDPDIIFCFGWSRLIGSQLLHLPRLGIIGYHPSALPVNRGRHPLIWALVLGLNETASTFFLMDQDIDSGDILSQVPIPIKLEDDARSLYDRVTQVALGQIRDFLPQLIDGNFQRISQNLALANTWRKRGEADGCIDWRMSAESIHNLVRGLARPYIGAHFNYLDSKFTVWRTELISDVALNLEPGKVLKVDENGIVIKTGSIGIRLLEIEPKVTFNEGQYL